MLDRTLVFATHNRHKLEEVYQIIGEKFQLKDLSQINCLEDIPETGKTLEENASIKSHFIYKNFEMDCFADDTGLEIEALNRAPGVYSARYAGEEKDNEKNMDLVLSQLQGISNRAARFRTVISLIIAGKEYIFEGVVKGEIMPEKSGSKGFGYDPIFKPEGFDMTFAEMSMEQKNGVSHRALAIRHLANFLLNYQR